MVQDKAQFAGNCYSLGKSCNAVLSHLWASLRARRETVIYGVRFLAKGATIRYETCLVFLQPDNDGFSVPVAFRSKAQCEGNGYSLGKRWNEAVRHHRGALWVSLSTPMDYVAPLGQGNNHCLRGAPCHEP